MKTLFGLCFSILTICISISSCKNASEKNASEKNNEYAKWETLYNTSQVFENYLKIYDSIKPKFIQVVKENGVTKDSSIVDFKNIDWEFWKQEMKKINLYSIQFDNKYAMQQFAMSEEGKLTTNISAVEKDLAVRKMMINTQLSNNDLMMLFAEYVDKGANKKLLYAPHKNLQLIEMQNGKVNIKQLDIVIK